MKKLSQNAKNHFWSAGVGGTLASAFIGTCALMSSAAGAVLGSGIVAFTASMLLVTLTFEKCSAKGEDFKPVSAVLAGVGTLAAAFTLALALKTNEAPVAPIVQHAPQSLQNNVPARKLS
jgi:hypothetical protein